MKVIMTGGGTGGHIYPAIAIADKIREKEPDAEVLFVGTEKGLESTLVPKNGYRIKYITASGIDRKHLLRNFKTLGDALKGDYESKQILKKFRPDVVIGTGGYVCGPVVRAADKLGIRTFVHEQNAFPGVTNKMLEKHVEKVLLAFEEAAGYFKNPSKLVTVGNPVRSEFFADNRAEKRRALGLRNDTFALLCFGGSRGAERINSVMIDVIEACAGDPDKVIYFATGEARYLDVLKAINDRGITLTENIHIMRYIDKMADYLKAADLVISRSGALAVSEIAVSGVPSVLIPSPNVTGNHQFFNAKTLADKGAAVLIEEKDLTSEKLKEVIFGLAADPGKRAEMAAAAKATAPGDAAEIIYGQITGK